MANVAETSRREISLYLVLEIMVIFLEKQLTHFQSSLIVEIYALTGRLLTGNIKNSICNGSVADLDIAEEEPAERGTASSFLLKAVSHSG